MTQQQQVNQGDTLNRPEFFQRLEGFLSGFCWFGGQAHGRTGFAFIQRKITTGQDQYQKSHYAKYTVKVSGKNAQFLEALHQWIKDTPEGESRNGFVSIKGFFDTYAKPTGQKRLGSDGQEYDETVDMTFFEGFDVLQVDPSTRQVQFAARNFQQQQQQQQQQTA